MRAQKIKFIFSGSFTKIQKKISRFFFKIPFIESNWKLIHMRSRMRCKRIIANIISRRLKRIGRRHRAQVALNGIFKSVLKQIYLLQRVVATAEQQSMRYFCCQKVNNRVSSREQPLVICWRARSGKMLGGEPKRTSRIFFLLLPEE